MKILKFGGSSLKNVSTIGQVVNIIKEKIKTDRIVVVASALSGVTDMLLELIRNISGDLKKNRQLLWEIHNLHIALANDCLSRSQDLFIREFEVLFTFFLKEWEEKRAGNTSVQFTDRILAYGEKWSVTLLENVLKENDISCKKFFADDFLITDSEFNHANIQFHKSRRSVAPVEEYIRQNGIPIVTGFIGRTEKGETTTLGRNGSDYTATALALLLKADLVEIWTDSNGILSADPAVYENAVNIPFLSFREARALSRYKSNVLHPRTIEPLELSGIPLLIKNVYQPQHKGTLIAHRDPNAPQQNQVASLIVEENLQKIRLYGQRIEENEILFKVLDEVTGRLGIPDLHMLSGNTCEVFVPAEKRDEFVLLIGSQLWQYNFLSEIKISVSDQQYQFIAVVGENIHQTGQIPAPIREWMTNTDVDVFPVTSGRKPHTVEFIFQHNNPWQILDTIHQSLFNRPVIHLYIAGPTGKVGKAFLHLLQSNQDPVHQFRFKIAGVINSRNYVVDHDGIPVHEIEHRLQQGNSYDPEQFMNLISHGPGIKLFVDITPSETIALFYEKLLLNSVGIVTANKVANALPFLHYQQLHALAEQKQVPFLYETNVGAATPVIGMIKDFATISDRVRKIEASLSGTLSFILFRLNQGKPFSEALKEALDSGFCEPNPLIDLHCIDAARKLIILMRELGLQPDFNDVIREPLVPLHVPYINDRQLLEDVRELDEFWRKRVSDARKKGKVLALIGSFDEQTAQIQVREVRENSIWNQVSFSENIFRVFIKGFEQHPLTLIGAGAGPEWTAYGLIRDIHKAAKHFIQYTSYTNHVSDFFLKGEYSNVRNPGHKEKVA